MRRRILFATVIVIPLLIAVVLVLRQWAQEARTAELLEQWQAAGGALTLAELKPEPISDEQNAAVLYEQAFAMIDGWTEEQQYAVKELIIHEVTSELVAESEPAIQLAIEAGRRTSCVWDTDTFETLEPSSFPRHREPLRLGRLLVLAAEFSLQHGDANRAVEHLTAVRSLSAHVARGPAMPAALASAAIDAHALGRFQTFFADRALPADVDKFTMLRNTLARRRWLMLTEASVMLKHVAEHHDNKLITLTRQRDLQHAMRCGLRALDSLDEPAGAISNYERFHAIPGGTSLSVGLLGYLLTADENIRRMHRWELAAQTAVALRRYRDEYGEYPDPAEWDMPIDPMSYQPMIYRRTDAGFEITSSFEDHKHPLSWQWN